MSNLNQAQRDQQSEQDLNSIPKVKCSKFVSKTAIKNKSKTNDRSSVVIHKNLAECAALESDEYWKNLYHDLSIGKNPTQLYISNNNIIYKGKQHLSYSLSDKSPELIVQELKQLLLKHTNISSEQDKLNKQLKIDDSQQKHANHTIDKWSQVKKKDAKEMLIINYVISQKNKHELSLKEAILFHDQLKNFFLMKYINPKDVIIQNNTIENIEGIVFDQDTKTFSHKNGKNIKIGKQEYSSRLDEKDMNEVEKCCSDMWEKYILSRIKLLDSEPV